MNIVLPALGVAFAAFCVWLIVRIINRKEPWAKWTLAVVAMAVVGYPLSSGPAAWLRVHTLPPSARKPLDAFYYPLGMVNSRFPWANKISVKYLFLWVDREEFLKTVAP